MVYRYNRNYFLLNEPNTTPSSTHNRFFNTLCTYYKSSIANRLKILIRTDLIISYMRHKYPRRESIDYRLMPNIHESRLQNSVHYLTDMFTILSHSLRYFFIFRQLYQTEYAHHTHETFIESN